MKKGNKCDYCWKRKTKPEFNPYCSRLCRGRAKRYKKTTTYCNFCGKKFHVRSDNYNPQKYCSTICRRKGRKRSAETHFNEELVMRTKARMPEKATDKVPGSAEKIKVMQERLQAGEELFHPNDLILSEELILGNYRNLFAKMLFSLDEEDQTKMLKLWNLA